MTFFARAVILRQWANSHNSYDISYNIYYHLCDCYLLRGSDGLYCFRRSFFLTVRTITHEPPHLAWRNLARTCTLTTARTLLNFKVISQRSRSFLIASGPKFTKLFSSIGGKIVVDNAVFRLYNW